MSANDKTLSPSAVARLTGVSTDTLRHYERRGVLPVPQRTTNGYRRYPSDTVPRVKLIQQALAIGFSLEDLARVLQERHRGGVPCRGVYELVTNRLAELDQRLADLTALRGNLAALLVQWKSRLEATPSGKRAHLLESLADGPSLQRPRASIRSRR